MKRSSGIKLMLMGTATVMLAACGDDEADTQPAGVFGSVDECIASGVYSEQYCQTGWKEALEQHREVAPRYATVADCEADFGAGQCQAAPAGQPAAAGEGATGGGGGSFFMPLMMGYLLGQAVEGFRGRAVQPLYRPNVYQGPPGSGSSGYGYAPGSWRTANNVEVAQRTGMTRLDFGSLSPPTQRTTTLQRGGFGARAASVASSGG